MKTKSTINTAAKCHLVALGLALAFLLTGCTVHRQYRADFSGLDTPAPLPGKLEELIPDPDSSTGPIPPEENRELLEDRVFESYQDPFLLAHVEFDDQGKFWEPEQPGAPNQITALEKRVHRDIAERPSAYRNGTLFIAFAHGWNNNAKEGNDNLDHFRWLLKRAADAEAKKLRRPVIGVYLSWRGDSMSRSNPLTKVPSFFTYWDRKATAHNIGTQSMGETLTRLFQLREYAVDYGEKKKKAHSKAKTRLIIVGHSFGAAALFSGVSRFFEDELIRVEDERYRTYIKRRWDLVLLVNPAFEALRYETINRYVSRMPLRGTDRFLQMPRMMVVSATNDKANSVAFPAGQTLGDLFRPKQGPNAHFDEDEQLTKALGFHAPFATHDLVVRQHPNGAEYAALKVRDEFLAQIEADQIPRRRETDMTPRGGTSFLREFDPIFAADSKYKRVLPFMVVHAEPEIVDNHGGIWNPMFQVFVRDFIAARERAALTLMRGGR